MFAESKNCTANTRAGQENNSDIYQELFHNSNMRRDQLKLIDFISPCFDRQYK